MQPQVLRCPQCGAPLHAPPQATTAQCTYCGSLVSLTAPPPPPIQPPPGASTATPPNVAGVVVLGGVLALAALGGAVAMLLPSGSSSDDSASGGLLGGSSTKWEGVHGAILADVNGDGVADLVGRERSVVPKDEVWLGAFDGRNGHELWHGAPLGTYIDTYQGALALAGDTLLYASSGGLLSGFSLRDGKRTWQSSLPERAAQFCDAGSGTVRVVLANHQEVTIRVANGQAAPPAKGDGSCTHLPDDTKWGDPSFTVEEHMILDHSVPGMRAELALQRPGGPRVLFGVRSEGTSVPMIGVAYPNDAARAWKSDLAGTRPLDTGPFAPEAAAITDAAAYTVYAFSDIQKPKMLVAFDLAGQRKWETPLPNTAPLSAVQARGNHVYVTQWGRLQAYDAATGKPVFSIGAGFP